MNVLESGQEELSRRFADKHEDRFDGVGYHRGPEGQVLLDGALAHIECERYAEYPGGDHTIVVGRVIGGDHPGGPPAALLPRRLRRLSDDHAGARSCSPVGVELLDDPAADPAIGGRVAPEHRPREPVVRRRGGGAARAAPGCWRGCPPAPRSPCSISAPASATCRAAGARWAARRGIRLAAGRPRAQPGRRAARPRGRAALRGRRAPARRRSREKSVDFVLVSQVAHHLAAESAVRLFRACDRLARRGVDRGRPPARPARPAGLLGRRARARLRPGHGGRRHHLAPARLHRRRAPRACSRPPACARIVERRPGYRLVATWRPAAR